MRIRGWKLEKHQGFGLPLLHFSPHLVVLLSDLTTFNDWLYLLFEDFAWCLY